MSDEIETFINGLYGEVESEKLAEQDLSHLSIAELEAILGIDTRTEEEKWAYSIFESKAAGCGLDDDFLAQFEGSPLKAQAIALIEKELALEAQNLRHRMQRDAQSKHEARIWLLRDQIRLQKQMLMLQLHKEKAQRNQQFATPAAQAVPTTPAKTEVKTSGQITSYTGGVNNGERQDPTWPKAALGVVSAGRPATLSESRIQNDQATPQHIEPKTASAGELLKKAVSMGCTRKSKKRQ